MELFSDEVYEKLAGEYEKAMKESWEKVLSGDSPFSLCDGENKKKGVALLKKAKGVCEYLLEKIEPFSGEIPDAVRWLIKENLCDIEKFVKEDGEWYPGVGDESLFLSAQKLCKIVGDAEKLLFTPDTNAILTRSLSIYTMFLLG